MIEETLLSWATYDRDQAYHAPRALHAREWAATRHVEKLEDALREARSRLGMMRDESHAPAA